MVLDVAKIKTPSSLSERAYEAIKETLLETDLAEISDEERIDERGLAQRLGVSRTPLREAITRLAMEGFLRIVPRKGVYVVKRSKNEIIEILLVRAALEGMAARLATRHVTEKDIERMKGLFSPFDQSIKRRQLLKYSEANIEFHELVLKASQCGKLIELAGKLFDHMRWISFRSVVYEERFQKMQKEHLEIIAALEKRNPDLAEKKMKAHIEGLARYIQEEVDFPS
jgi:DNA-binding GntR family transcriptional regulator